MDGDHRHRGDLGSVYGAQGSSTKREAYGEVPIECHAHEDPGGDGDSTTCEEEVQDAEVCVAGNLCAQIAMKEFINSIRDARA